MRKGDETMTDNQEKEEQEQEEKTEKQTQILELPYALLEEICPW